MRPQVGSGLGDFHDQMFEQVEVAPIEGMSDRKTSGQHPGGVVGVGEVDVLFVVPHNGLQDDVR